MQDFDLFPLSAPSVASDKGILKHKRGETSIESSISEFRLSNLCLVNEATRDFIKSFVIIFPEQKSRSPLFTNLPNPLTSNWRNKNGGIKIRVPFYYLQRYPILLKFPLSIGINKFQLSIYQNNFEMRK